MRTERKLALIQLDAGDIEYIRANLGALPAMARLIGAGGAHPLEVEPLAGSSNMTFNTGLHPVDHGMFFQMQWDPAGMRFRSVDPGWVGAQLTPFWRKGRLARLKALIVDPAYTFAGGAPGHLEVRGWSAHSALTGFQSNDRAERRRIAGAYGVNPIGHEHQLRRGPEARAVERDRIIGSARKRARLLCDLIARRDWDFLYAVFAETHRGGHVLWPQEGVTPRDGLLDVYKAVDAAVGEVVTALPENTDVVLFAVHGMARQSSQSHFLKPLLDAGLRAAGHDPVRRAARSGAVAWLRRNLPQSIQWRIRDNISLRLRDRVIAREFGAGVVPGETIAIPLPSDNHGYWRVLTKGREARGTLDEAAARQFCDDFAEVIAGFRTPDGQPLVTDVLFPSREAGARAHLMPDVVACWNEAIRPMAEARHPKLGVIRAEPHLARTGNHRFRGFYAHAGAPPPGAPAPRHIADLPAYVEAILA